MDKEMIIKKLRENKKYLQKEYNVVELGFFGSFVRNKQTEDSDVDILIEVEKGRMSLLRYMRLKHYLEGILGRKVDLVLKDSIKPRLRNKILKETIYV
jgi:predicted nucleotidyltransferase